MGNVRAPEANILQHVIAHGCQMPHVAPDAQFDGNCVGEPQPNPDHNPGKTLRRMGAIEALLSCATADLCTMLLLG
jgi:hypothetical protein